VTDLGKSGRFEERTCFDRGGFFVVAGFDQLEIFMLFGLQGFVSDLKAIGGIRQNFEPIT
jgi:hypothetical protein